MTVVSVIKKMPTIQHDVIAIKNGRCKQAGFATCVAPTNANQQKQIDKSTSTTALQRTAHQRTARLNHNPATAIAISTIQVNTVPQNRPNE